MAVVASATLLSACIGEAAGTQVFGLNESDRDVIVASSHHRQPSVVLPAHTWAKLFDDYAPPSGEVTVFDRQCRLLVKLPLTRALETLRVGTQGEIELIGRSAGPLPSGVRQGDATTGAGATCS